jgi:predicted Rossmann-fold nucleotide-binding protein
MKKLILIGANSKANDEQCTASFNIGKALAELDYLTIHGGGDGVMVHCTKGMQSIDKDKGDSLTHIIWPDNMIPKKEETLKIYNDVKKITRVNDINTRISLLCKEAKESNYIVMFGGGIGTIHEVLSFMVHYYDHAKDMPDILYCSDGDDGFITRLLLLLIPLNIETRPYMDTLLNKIIILKSEEIVDVLKNGL